MVAEADVAGCVHGPVDLSYVPGCRRQRRRPGGLGSGRGEAGEVAGVEPGRQGLDPVAVEQDVNLAETGPEPDGAGAHARVAGQDCGSHGPADAGAGGYTVGKLA